MARRTFISPEKSYEVGMERAVASMDRVCVVAGASDELARRGIVEALTSTGKATGRPDTAALSALARARYHAARKAEQESAPEESAGPTAQ